MDSLPTICECKDRYSIEQHGNGYALYFGRCQHRHGYNLAHITETSPDVIKRIETALNETMIKD